MSKIPSGLIETGGWGDLNEPTYLSAKVAPFKEIPHILLRWLLHQFPNVPFFLFSGPSHEPFPLPKLFFFSHAGFFSLFL